MREKKIMKTQSVPESTNFIHTFSLCISLHTTCTAKIVFFFYIISYVCVCVCSGYISIGNWIEFVSFEWTLVCTANFLECVCVVHHHLLIVFYIILLVYLFSYSCVSFPSSFICFLLPLQPLVKVTCFDSASDATNTRTVYRSSCSGWRKNKEIISSVLPVKFCNT